MCLFEVKLNVGKDYPVTKVAVAEPHMEAATGIEAARALSNVAVAAVNVACHLRAITVGIVLGCLFFRIEVPDRGAPLYETAAQTVDRYSYC